MYAKPQQQKTEKHVPRHMQDKMKHMTMFPSQTPNAYSTTIMWRNNMFCTVNFQISVKYILKLRKYLGNNNFFQKQNDKMW